ncbi:MAG: hypothetical protein AAF750_09100 [Planctomycetota bacterium]
MHISYTSNAVLIDLNFHGYVEKSTNYAQLGPNAAHNTNKNAGTPTGVAGDNSESVGNQPGDQGVKGLNARAYTYYAYDQAFFAGIHPFDAGIPGFSTGVHRPEAGIAGLDARIPPSDAGLARRFAGKFGGAAYKTRYDGAVTHAVALTQPNRAMNVFPLPGRKLTVS